MSATAAASSEEKEAVNNESSLATPSDEKQAKIVEDQVVGSGESSPGGSPSTSTAWLVGDIVWAKIPGHPWWPSMVAYEPNTAVYFKYMGRTRYYHVQFFGHEPMRGWATEKSIILYQGGVQLIHEHNIINIQHDIQTQRILNICGRNSLQFLACLNLF